MMSVSRFSVAACITVCLLVTSAPSSVAGDEPLTPPNIETRCKYDDDFFDPLDDLVYYDRGFVGVYAGDDACSETESSSDDVIRKYVGLDPSEIVDVEEFLRCVTSAIGESGGTPEEVAEAIGDCLAAGG